MGFDGPFKGSLALAVPEPFGGQVAANVLGLDMDDPKTENGTVCQTETNCAVDALKELLNVTCGNLLTAIAGDEPVFDLTVPEVTLLSEDEWRATPGLPDAVGFLVEDWPVFLRLTLQGEAETSESGRHEPKS
jgi:CheY-specific phosphatase CheX